MGGSFDYRVYATPDRAAVQKQWAQAVAHSLAEDGRSYSGCIGMMGPKIAAWHSKPMSQDEAHDFLSERHDKWDPAQAVAVFLTTPPSEKDKARKAQAHQEVAKETERLRDAMAEVLKDFKALGREFATCSSCGSKLARAKLPDYCCPLCHVRDEPLSGFLGTQRQLQRLETARKRVAEAHEALAGAGKPKLDEKTGWLVGGWCSS